MTRFREEHYDTKGHRAWVKVQGTDYESDPYAEGTWSAPWSEERRALRSEYLKKAAQSRKAGQTTKILRRTAWQDPGFG